MKLEEIYEGLTEEQLEEIKLRHALAVGAIAAATAISPSHKSSEAHLRAPVTHQVKHELSTNDLLGVVLDNYGVAKPEAERIVKLAKKYEKPSFPRAEDILAVIGIESSFDKNAKSGLKKDPAIGLTQIRPKIWGIKPAVLKHNVEEQIKKASEILAEYYHKLGSEEKAIDAYNVGISNHKKGKNNPNYVKKWKLELAKYENKRRKA
jgi:hypothetical protein